MAKTKNLGVFVRCRTKLGYRHPGPNSHPLLNWFVFRVHCRPVSEAKPLSQASQVFHVADLSAAGDLLLQQDYTYGALETIPFAWEVIVRCATQLWRSPEEFDLSFSSGDVPRIQLRWRLCAKGAGILTLRCEDQLCSVSLLAGGLDHDGDLLTLQAFQQHLLRALHDTGSEPAFSLMELPQRPLLATILLLPPASHSARVSIAVMDRCFAAAFFRYEGLV
jgi:hypothetical protein